MIHFKKTGTRMAEMRDICVSTVFAVIIASLFLYAHFIGFGRSSLSFLAIGDFGGLPAYPYTTMVERVVARHMADHASSNHVDFVLTLGDNFYYDGVVNVEDKRFYETYAHAFDYSSLDKPWYITAGNHDYRGNVSAQIAYSQVNSNWNYPSLYYTVKYKVPQSKKTLQIIMIDTVQLCGGSDDFKNYPPKGPENSEEANIQWDWIKKEIQSSTAEYLIVAGHYPVISIAEHGSTRQLVRYLQPLLEKNNVTAYFSGHEHNLQHLQSNYYGPMNYFISGCANFVDDSRAHIHDVPVDKVKFWWAGSMALGGFGSVKVTDEMMEVSYYQAGSDSERLYSYTLQPRDIKQMRARKSV